MHARIFPSFWEFLDIEFDESQRLFRFVAYYTVQPSFPHLFQRLVGSPALKTVEAELVRPDEKRIHKQDWKPRAELEFELGAKNALYTLFDSVAKLIYIGEAEDLVKRLAAAASLHSQLGLFQIRRFARDIEALPCRP